MGKTIEFKANEGADRFYRRLRALREEAVLLESEFRRYIEGTAAAGKTGDEVMLALVKLADDLDRATIDAFRMQKSLRVGVKTPEQAMVTFNGLLAVTRQVYGISGIPPLTPAADRANVVDIPEKSREA